MDWKGEWIIDASGRVLWRETMRVQDELMVKAFIQNQLIGFLIESSAIMGVKTGMA